MFKILLLSTSVGSLGSGQGGGVELTVQNLAQELCRRGHHIKVVAPAGSWLNGVEVITIGGNLQVPVQTQSRDMPIYMPDNGVLANMWEYARQVQLEYDLVVNFAFDWLPFYLTPFFETTIAHFISMGSMTTASDRIMEQVIDQYPGTFGVYTKSQADTFSFGDECEILSSAIDIALYEFNNAPQDCLAWLGRIAPEKALEDAVAAINITDTPLKIFGKIQDEEYWQKICRDFPDAPIEYQGFLDTKKLQKELGQCRGLLMTPRWIEAFGNVAIEALACGVPIIAYRRGGPAEIVQHDRTGFLVEPDSITGLVEAIKQINKLDRAACRRQAESEYSLEALGDRFEAWFQKLVINDHKIQNLTIQS
ncbi:glycosyltransferase family 4 protein [Waterburya agarophytonicola K14]|uniref:Glycosyltransferase family 4 protein n=1 Tax=Waterburya agarophytonicola KI4 TaxID=2874699 RepID=A0A964FID3_9CYAN|nr:glycosyltransferase family 4 protein [Waterburya agarophytonicola]MCC0178364.1 glycosyltransferase family 4 protein [Waterburya agarophytonicola KI4]